MDAGWYKDPFGRFEQRFHDGHSWTDHVATGGIQDHDAPVPPPPTTGPAPLPPVEASTPRLLPPPFPAHLQAPPSPARALESVTPAVSPTAVSAPTGASSDPLAVTVQSHYVCARHGRVTPKAIKGVDKTTKTKRVSGGKATAALLTGGASVLVTGIRSKKDSKTTVMVCPKCKREVQAV